MALPALAYKALQHRPKLKTHPDVIKILLTTGIGLGVFWGVRAIIKKVKTQTRERQALFTGNPANYASQLKMAFENDNTFGWGTDEESIFRVLETIPSQSMMRKVQRAYTDLYGNNLATDLKEELTTEEYATALDIINIKT